jgi:hypothetical protein
MTKFRFSKSRYGAPEGVYRAKFLGIKENSHPEFGPGYEWRFEVTHGPHAGQMVSRTTPAQPTAKNACGRMVKGLLGGKVDTDAEIDVDVCIGKEYTVTIEENSTGTGTRVGSVMVRGQAFEEYKEEEEADGIPF